MWRKKFGERGRIQTGQLRALVCYQLKVDITALLLCHVFSPFGVSTKSLSSDSYHAGQKITHVAQKLYTEVVLGNTCIGDFLTVFYLCTISIWFDCKKR